MSGAPVTTPPLDLLRPRRTIAGMSAILLPHRSPADPDWAAFEAHVERTAGAGLVPAVNMDTGYVHLLSSEQRAEVLARTTSLGVEFVAGAFDEADVDVVQGLGGTPVLFPSAVTHDVVPAYQRIAAVADRFLGFELSPVFNPDGRIWDLDTYRAVLDIPQCIGAKHSSLSRQAEWDRLRLRDEVRPDVPGAHRQRPRHRHGDVRQRLPARACPPSRRPSSPPATPAGPKAMSTASTASTTSSNGWGRPPSAPRCPPTATTPRSFFHLRGWASSDATPDGAPRRPAWEVEVLREISGALEAVA